MAAKRNGRGRGNGSNRLEEAMALLLANQAQFVGHLRAADERFARIELELEQIKALLMHHQRMLEAMPEVIRDKIGFRVDNP
jgi:hypothetical protein